MTEQSLAQKNKQIIYDYTLAVQRHKDFDAIEKFVSPDFYNHDVFPGVPRDREGSKELFHLLWGAFPDMDVEIHDQVAEGALVTTRKTITGTHKGDFLGVSATNKPFRLEVIDTLEVKGGQITAHWAVADIPGFWKQLGVER
ncbi:MAG: ester cyclase [Chloroflexi bacterium]|nr:ester cyclase [Chloroflexota bacterium]